LTVPRYCREAQRERSHSQYHWRDPRRATVQREAAITAGPDALWRPHGARSAGPTGTGADRSSGWLAPESWRQPTSLPRLAAASSAVAAAWRKTLLFAPAKRRSSRTCRRISARWSRSVPGRG